MLLRAHLQAHEHKIEHDVCFFAISPSHWSIALANRESQSMHWLIMTAGQVIGGAEQTTANIKIQKTIGASQSGRMGKPPLK